MKEKPVEPEQHEEEYHFEESNNAGENAYSSLTKPEQDWRAHLNRRTAMIAIGVLVVIIAVYKLLGALFATSDHPAVPTISSQPQAAVVAPQVSAVIPQQPAPVVTDSLATLNRKIVELAQQTNGNQATLQRIENSVSGLRGNIADIQTQLSGLNGALARISAQQQQTAMIAAQRKKADAGITSEKVAPPPIFYLQAAVPGRAWLKGSDGSTITVKVGDRIIGYGFVTSISAVVGTVTTSSGKTIGYPPNEEY